MTRQSDPPEPTPPSLEDATVVDPPKINEGEFNEMFDQLRRDSAADHLQAEHSPSSDSDATIPFHSSAPVSNRDKPTLREGKMTPPKTGDVAATAALSSSSDQPAGPQSGEVRDTTVDPSPPQTASEGSKGDDAARVLGDSDPAGPYKSEVPTADIPIRVTDPGSTTEDGDPPEPGEVAKFLGEPTPGIHIRVAAQTAVGLVREHNEDNMLVADLDTKIRGSQNGPVARHKLGPCGSVFAVCDGMGGAAHGEVASQMAVDTLFEVMTAKGVPTDRDVFARRLVRAIETAGERIFAKAKSDRAHKGMGTTSTVAGVMDKILFVGQVGDSRAYVLRGRDFRAVTKDQSLIRQLIDAGQFTEEEAASIVQANIITQALGTLEKVDVDLTFLELRRGDRLMLCSDGLSGLVHDDIMKEVLGSIREPSECCRRLIELACNGGGHDNITVVVVDFDGEGLEENGGEHAVAYQQYPLPVTTSESVAPPSATQKVSRRAPQEKAPQAAAIDTQPANDAWKSTALFIAVAMAVVAYWYFALRGS